MKVNILQNIGKKRSGNILKIASLYHAKLKIASLYLSKLKKRKDILNTGEYNFSTWKKVQYLEEQLKIG